MKMDLKTLTGEGEQVIFNFFTQKFIHDKGFVDNNNVLVSFDMMGQSRFRFIIE